MNTEITLQKVTPEDLSALLIFSKKTFFDAFYHLNDPVDMEAYAAKNFTHERTLLELANPNSEFYFALIRNEIAGYIKLNHGSAQTEFQDAEALEIERVYVSRYHQNKGIGLKLLDHAIEQAKARQLQYVWLGVWEKNEKAIRFYQRSGFEVFNQHYFFLGNDVQIDVLMRKSLH